MSQKNKVELRHAYVWTCEECGRDNFGSAMSVEAGPGEVEQMRAAYDIDPDIECDWIALPENVTCKFCNAEFEAEPYHIELNE